jgi:hypothetical protein
MNETYNISYSENSVIFYEKIHNYKKLIDIIQTEDKMDIDKIVKQYMMKYGIDNVRGGSYQNPKLEEWMIKSLENEFIMINNTKSKESKEKDFPDLSNLENEIDKISNLDMIEKEINTYSNIRQMMLKIKTEILLSTITINGIESIDKFIEDYENYQSYLAKYKKVEILSQYINNIEAEGSRIINNDEFINTKKEFKILAKELFMTTQSPYYNIIDTSDINNIQFDNIMQIINTVRSNFGKIRNINSNMDSKINQVSHYYNSYMNYIGKNYEIPETDPFVQLYQLRIYNIQNKKKLEILVKENGSEEKILLKLKSLYKEKILFIENNF